MSDEILEKSLKIIFTSEFTRSQSPEDLLALIWHAGEPLTAGFDYYKKALSLIYQYNQGHTNLHLGIQTNGTLLNDDWCRFAKENKIEITLSVDGPAFIHDSQRVRWNGSGSFKAVKRGMKHLQKHGLPLQTICVLTHESLNYPDEMYSFFRDEKFTFVGFNIDELQGTYKTSSYLDSGYDLKTQIRDKYYHFFSRLYDLWVADGKLFEIREFQKAATALLVKKYTLTSIFPTSETLAFAMITITKEGNISTYSPELASGTADNIHKFSLANVHDIDKFEDLLHHKNFLDQQHEMIRGIRRCASECAYFDLCGGGTAANKFYENGSFDSTETIFCYLTKKTMYDLMLDKLTLSNSSEEKLSDPVI